MRPHVLLAHSLFLLLLARPAAAQPAEIAEDAIVLQPPRIVRQPLGNGIAPIVQQPGQPGDAVLSLLLRTEDLRFSPRLVLARSYDLEACTAAVLRDVDAKLATNHSDKLADLSATCRLESSQKEKLLLALQYDSRHLRRGLKSWLANSATISTLDGVSCNEAIEELTRLNALAERCLTCEHGLFPELASRLLSSEQKRQIAHEYCAWFAQACRNTVVLSPEQTQRLEQALAEQAVVVPFPFQREKVLAAALQNAPEKSLREFLSEAEIMAVHRLMQYFKRKSPAQRIVP